MLCKVENVIDSDIIYKNKLINYKLRIWLDKSKEEEISKLEDYKAFLKLKIEAEQRPETMKVQTFKYTGDVQTYIVSKDGYYPLTFGHDGHGYIRITLLN